ncbi:helix-turn-helix transcriptional regulator [Amycolatopsis cihanbeyliensis]|uniref:helix-turn-helix transcriptional regulator n=1 Tax=Amycolatopsis cihanbeyliensis TaxID=1128664 RepID=UPI00114EB353|nr:helix-turn-helix transcriptional regulator [Amycolatopsis cihanbeyliensis]
MLHRLRRLACRATSVDAALSGHGVRLPSHDSSLLELLAVAGRRRRLLVDTQFARSELMAGDAVTRPRRVRVHEHSLRRMLIFDDRCAILPLDQAGWDAGAVLLRAPLAGPCGQLFDFLWSEARPLTDDLRCDAGLSDRQLEVVYLLLQGATDQQVADRIGVSSRTVRSMVSTLQRRFGTSSRMALGFRLARAVTSGSEQH